MWSRCRSLPARVAASLLGAFGALAIVLVLVGTYGVMSYGIVQRTREICIRLAVGASPSHIVRLVLGRASVVWALGVGSGAAAAIVGAPLLSPFLIGVKPRDPVAYRPGVRHDRARHRRRVLASDQTRNRYRPERLDATKLRSPADRGPAKAGHYVRTDRTAILREGRCDAAIANDVDEGARTF